MNELFERIKKILNINKCEIQINEKFIFVHINLHISIKIDDEINRKIQNIVYNHFNETSEYEDFSIKIIFSRSNEKIEKIEESKPAQESKKKKRIQGIKNIILVASGKGGCWKINTLCKFSNFDAKNRMESWIAGRRYIWSINSNYF